MSIQAAQAVANAVFSSIAYDQEDITVPSPPGAGKTYLTEGCQAFAGLHLGMTTLVGTNTNAQADDIVIRTARRFPRLIIQRLTSGDYDAPADLTSLPNVIVDKDINGNTHSVVATTAKLNEMTSPPTANLLIIDEAWQLRFADFLPIRELAPRAILIGDPGQIDPLVKIPVRNWADDPAGPHLPAPKVILSRNEARCFQLPVSRRLPTDSAKLVREAFYPGMQFTGIATPAQRRVQFATPGRTKLDKLLDRITAVGSMSAVTMPQGVTPVTDEGLIDLTVSMIDRLVRRKPTIIDGEQTYQMLPRHIGIVAARREQVSSITQALGPMAEDILVDTANRYQGLERPIMFSLHPLSGMLRPTAFELNPGRMCVSLSRHRNLCVLMAREGITDTLAAYVPEDDRFLGQIDDPVHTGWYAHGQIWNRLSTNNLLFAA